MVNIKLTVAYDGTNYHGFQEQRGTGLATVQEMLEKSLAGILHYPVQVIGAGRTDAGVHALGQVVNFREEHWPIPAAKVPFALNSLLPGDIAVVEASLVPDSFHARFSAKAKTYRYTIYNHPIPAPHRRLYSYHVPWALDYPAMAEAARHLEGKHDFKAFQAQGTPVKTTVRTIFKAEVNRDGPEITFDFCGDGFLYNMVRIMTGTLLLAGKRKILPDQVADIIHSKNRTQAGTTVPPHGLCLMKVEYDL